MRRRSARRRWVWSGAALAVTLVVSAVGPAGAAPAGAAEFDPAEPTPLSVPGMPVSLAQSGELGLWGDDTYGQSSVPASLEGVAISQLVSPERARLALTADGRVVGWGSNPERLERVPAEVAAAKVAQIATQHWYAGAVTRDGRVLTWGAKRIYPTPLDVPAGLTGVKQLAMTGYTAAALKHDGSVVAWGQPEGGRTEVPEGLKATAIAATMSSYLALTEQGKVVTWGSPLQGDLPASVQEAGNVKAIAASGSGALALLADNTLEYFDVSATYELPAEVAAAEPVLLANGVSGPEFAIVDRDRTIHYWQTGLGVEGEVPVEFNGRDLVQIVLGPSQVEGVDDVRTGGVISTKMLRAELPRVTGVPQPGSVLTGVPGTFSAEPDTVTNQWLVDDVPVAGAGDQLTITAAMVGKKIAYQSSATKAGEDSVTATSPAVVVAVPGPSAACVAAQQSATAAVKALTAAKAKFAKAKKKLKKAKKSNNVKKVKKAKAKQKKAKKQVKSTTATVAATGKRAAATC